MTTTDHPQLLPVHSLLSPSALTLTLTLAPTLVLSLTLILALALVPTLALVLALVHNTNQRQMTTIL